MFGKLLELESQANSIWSTVSVIGKLYGGAIGLIAELFIIDSLFTLAKCVKNLLWFFRQPFDLWIMSYCPDHRRQYKKT